MRKLFLWAAVMCWMGVIFILSQQPAEKSNELSTGVTEIIVEKIEQVAPHQEFDVESFNHMVRKNAHFFAYMVLGILLTGAWRRSGSAGYQGLLLALLCCVLFAVSDEIHQIFISGRGPQVKDVLIDSSGALVGIGIYLLVAGAGKRIKFQPQ